MDHEQIPVVLLLENILCCPFQNDVVGTKPWKDIETIIHELLYIFIFECLKFMLLFK